MTFSFRYLTSPISNVYESNFYSYFSWYS